VPSIGEEHVALSHYIEHEMLFSGTWVLPHRQVAKPTDYSRNRTVDTFRRDQKAQECEWYYTIDSDTVPPTGTLNRLLSHDRDVVCAVTFSVTKGILWMPVMRENPTGTWSPDEKVYSQETYPLVKIDGIGAACMLVKRKVIEHVYQEFGVCFKDRYNEEGKRILGQDLDFSRKVRRLGYDVWADLGIVCDHYKRTNLKSIAEAMLGERNVLRVMSKGLINYFGSPEEASKKLFDGKIALDGLREFAEDQSARELTPIDDSEILGEDGRKDKAGAELASDRAEDRREDAPVPAEKA
jgi:GT2 family glycosyltransferase